MSEGDRVQRQAQLDKEERELLEEVVTNLREIVEDEVEYLLEHQYHLTDRETSRDLSEKKLATRSRLVNAIEHENPGDKDWDWCYDQYVIGVGFTIVNRLAAFRCMEVRGFLDHPVTQIGDSGLTPAAERVLGERFDVGRNDALITAYHEECVLMEEEIEILFNLDSPYSLVDPDPDLFSELVEGLDRIPQSTWRADDVLGWVYEYYNTPKLSEVRKKAREGKLESEDVPAANQFYTPHWVVRQLTDNSLGKLYLESKNEFQPTVERQSRLSGLERKSRSPHIEDTPTVSELCTYLIPSESSDDNYHIDHPRELRVMDPACGSGHFLLYAFDVFERIWRTETDVSPGKIPDKILRYNLFGVDLDMRACQLAAFNLYLKGRMRAEAEGNGTFTLPRVGIVCADARISNFDESKELLREVAGEKESLQEALESLLDQFEDVHGIGSLLDIRGTLSEEFLEEQADSLQTTFEDDWESDLTLQGFLKTLEKEIEVRRGGDSFVAQDLKSFVRLLTILAQDYDISLMNPPYGSAQRGRMPQSVKSYVEEHYDYAPQYYINFFEVCERMMKKGGRVGMLVPRSFMFKRRYQDFREDFIGDRGAFDFISEFGEGILDNATVRTVGTVVRTGERGNERGEFIRLHDIETERKEEIFLRAAFEKSTSDGIKRLYEVKLGEFEKIPGSPLSYWTPAEVRDFHQTNKKLDPDAAKIDGTAICSVKTGIQTGKNQRFVKRHWEVTNQEEYIPYAKGGEEAWINPHIDRCINWYANGDEVERYKGSKIYNEEFFYLEGLTWTYSKETGRRFGYYPPGGIFDIKGSMIFTDEISTWTLMSVLNSTLYHGIFLSLTPERDWGVSDVGRVPWNEEFEEENKKLEEASIKQYEISRALDEYNSRSPFYTGPEIFPEDREFFYNHPYTEDAEPSSTNLSTDLSLWELSEAARKEKRNRVNNLEEIADSVDELIFEMSGFSENTQEAILQEIALRTSEDPRNRTPETGSIDLTKEEVSTDVKKLLHYLSLEIVRRSENGIVPVGSQAPEIETLFDAINNRFNKIFGDQAEERLAEADRLLGNISAGETAYPNIERWLSDELFTYHLETFQKSPIMWKLTTKNTVSDPTGEGFECLLDYHSLTPSVFDRVQTQYLEPEKSELRERRNSADRRRNNDSLSQSEQTQASEEFNQCVNAIRQIEEFENTLRDLTRTSPRSWSSEDQRKADELQPKVANFREMTVEILAIFDQLFEVKDDRWLEDTFSSSFLETLEENRKDWIVALRDLETACEEYSKPATEAIPAHLYDLFEYFENDLIGSVWPTSTGLLSMGYYPRKEGENYLDEDGQPKDSLTDDGAKLLADIAAKFNAYEKLAEEIESECIELKGNIPTEWKDRALSEVTTAGYHPNRKHGVAINIEPIAKAELVPSIVKEEVV